MMIATVSFASGIQWGAVGNYLYDYDGSTYLTGGTVGTVGCFVQLIWVGANGAIDSAIASGTGVSIDDSVVDYAFVGAGSAAGEDGWFDGQSVEEGGDVQDGYAFYLRTWDKPASSYASGVVPEASVYYGNSTTWTWIKTASPYESHDFSADGAITASNLIAVPEPTTLAFLGIGLGAFFMRRRMKK